MIKHIVIWKFKDQTSTGTKADNLAKAVSLLKPCATLVDGTLEFDVALGAHNKACTADLVLYSAFASQAALDAYQDHPDHATVKTFMKQAVASRECMDYTL